MSDKIPSKVFFYKDAKYCPSCGSTNFQYLRDKEYDLSYNEVWKCDSCNAEWELGKVN